MSKQIVRNPLTKENMTSFALLLGNMKIEVVPCNVPDGVTSISYKRNGKVKRRVISHQEFQKEFNKKQGYKKPRLQRKKKKWVTKAINKITPEIKTKGISGCKRVHIYNSIINQLKSPN